MSNETDCGTTPNGGHLYCRPNGVGGYIYTSDEIGGGVVVWDTALVSESTLLFALTCEKNRKCKDEFERLRLLEDGECPDIIVHSAKVAMTDSLAMLDRSIDDMCVGNTQQAKLAIQEIADSLGLQLPKRNDHA